MGLSVMWGRLTLSLKTVTVVSETSYRLFRGYSDKAICNLLEERIITLIITLQFIFLFNLCLYKVILTLLDLSQSEASCSEDTELFSEDNFETF